MPIFGSFVIQTNEYALPVENFREVVNAPAAFTTVPLAPEYMLGVYNLRGTIIPIVDLRVLLKLELTAHDPATSKIGIIEHENVLIGILFDRAGEVLRRAEEALDRFDYDASSDRPRIISGMIQMDEGRRLIELLDIHVLAHLANIPHSDILKQNRMKRNRQARKQCISFRVGESLCAFSIGDIQEIISVPPLRSSALGVGNCLGIFDIRGKVVPLIDFASHLNLQAPITRDELNSSHRILIMKSQDHFIGLLIGNVESIISYFVDEILEMTTLSSTRPNLFTGFLARQDEEDIILLNRDEIFSANELKEMAHGHSRVYREDTDKIAADAKAKAARSSYLVFKYRTAMATRLDEIREIVDSPTSLLKPPGLQKEAQGVLNLRGQMILVLKPESVFTTEGDLSTGPVTSKILIFENDGQKLGLLVESVESIRTFSDDEKIPLPRTLYVGATVPTHSSEQFAFEDQTGGEKRTLLRVALRELIAPVVETIITELQSA